MLASLTEQIWHHVSGRANLALRREASRLYWQINFWARFLSKKESGCVTSVYKYQKAFYFLGNILDFSMMQKRKL